VQELRLVLALEQVLQRALVLELPQVQVQEPVQQQELELGQVLLQQQQSRHRNLEQQLLVSSSCHASTESRRRFSIAGFQNCCASCRCWWLNQLRKQNLRQLLLLTTLPIYLVSSFVSSEISLQQRCGICTFRVPSHNPLLVIVPQP
jgi:hypothetical protein